MPFENIYLGWLSFNIQFLGIIVHTFYHSWLRILKIFQLCKSIYLLLGLVVQLQLRTPSPRTIQAWKIVFLNEWEQLPH